MEESVQNCKSLGKNDKMLKYSSLQLVERWQRSFGYIYTDKLSISRDQFTRDVRLLSYSNAS